MKNELLPVSADKRNYPRRIRTTLAVLLVIALTGASSFIEGGLSNRWVKPADLIAAGRMMTEVPARFGDWELQTARPLEDGVVEMLQCVGSTQRIYRNRSTGQIVSMFLIVGPPGPTSVHTPEICYSSRDYDDMEARKQFRVRESQQPNEAFWEVTFRRNDLYADMLRVAYAWNAGDGWQAPEWPRFTFGRQPLLYKLQVAGAITPGTNLDQNDPCRSFLRDFLPALDSALFQPSVGQPSP